MQQNVDGGAGDVSLVLNSLQAVATDEDPETDPDVLPTTDELHSSIPAAAAAASAVVTPTVSTVQKQTSG